MIKPKVKVSSTPIKTPKGLPTTLYISRLHSDVSTSMEVSIEKIKCVIELLKTDENLKIVLDGIVGSITEKL